jgi:DNA-binding beta-propeller fold protein YncE
MPPLKIPGLLLLAASAACAGNVFLPAYPAGVVIFDESKGVVTDKIPMSTGIPMSIRMSQDRKKIYVTTVDHNGIEVIDPATRKVINHFILNTPTKQYRFSGGVADPTDKFFYTISTEIEKDVDHYSVGKPKYTVIDLTTQKIAKTFDMLPQDEKVNGGPGFGRGNLEISPDGKYIYQFRDSIIVMKTDDFSVVERIELAKPDLPGLEGMRFGPDLDSISENGQHISVFNAEDPYVHNKVFGIGRFDLSNRNIRFDPIGPAPQAMSGLQISGDKKSGYVAVTNLTQGNKRCEFWSFDLATLKLRQTQEFACRARFTFGISGDGKKLYIYGAGYEIDQYDAASLKFEKTFNLNSDITYGGMVIVP